MFCARQDGAGRGVGRAVDGYPLSIRLPEDWKRRIEALAGDADQRTRVLREREEVQEKLRRLKLLFRDLLIDDREYRASYDQLQGRLASLVLPNSPHIVKAGEYLENLGMLWSQATLEEQRDITRVMLKAVQVDVEEERIVAIEPTPIFQLLFQEFCQGLGVEVI